MTTSTTANGLSSISAATNPATSSLASKSSTSSAGTSSTSAGSLGLDETTFLKLLTTQLQNQDPTNPTDTNQFTQQVATLSQVEAATNSNTKLDTIISELGGSASTLSAQLSTASNYIGKKVQVTGNTFAVAGSGNVQMSYDVPAGTANSTITITDSNGKNIGSFAGKNTQGKQNVTWDGTNASGSRVASGSYTISVNLVDGNNKSTSATTYVYENVNSAEVDSGTTNLVLDQGQVVPMSSIISVQ